MGHSELRIRIPGVGGPLRLLLLTYLLQPVAAQPRWEPERGTYKHPMLAFLLAYLLGSCRKERQAIDYSKKTNK